MTIKKPMKAPAAAPAAPGGATIANRFKLDLAEPEKKPAVAGKGTTCAAVAGLIALGVAGLLTFILWKHWEFLMPA